MCCVNMLADVLMMCVMCCASWMVRVVMMCLMCLRCSERPIAWENDCQAYVTYANKNSQNENENFANDTTDSKRKLATLRKNIGARRKMSVLRTSNRRLRTFARKEKRTCVNRVMMEVMVVV